MSAIGTGFRAGLKWWRELENAKSLKEIAEQSSRKQGDEGPALGHSTERTRPAQAPDKKMDSEVPTGTADDAAPVDPADPDAPIEGELLDPEPGPTPAQIVEPEGDLPEPAPVSVEDAGAVAEAAARSATGAPEHTPVNFEYINAENDIEQMQDTIAKQLQDEGRGAESTTVQEIGEKGERLIKKGYGVKDVLRWDEEVDGVMPVKMAANRIILTELSDALQGVAAKINANRTGVGDDVLAEFRINIAKYKSVLEVVMKQTRMASQTLNQFKFVAQDNGLLREQHLKDILDDTGGRDAAIELARLIDEQVHDVEGLVDVVKDTWWARARGFVEGYRYNSMLSGLETQERNLLGNALMSITRILETPAAAGVSAVRKGARKLAGKSTPHAPINDGVRFLETAARMQGVITGIPEGLVLAMRALTNPDFDLMGRKLDRKTASFRDLFPRREVSHADRNPIGRVAAEVGSADNVFANAAFGFLDFVFLNAAGRVLNAGDVLFKAMNARSEQLGLITRIIQNEGLSGEQAAARVKQLTGKHVPRDLAEQTIQGGNFATFTNELGQVGRFMSAIRQRLAPLKVVVPFYKTLVNITRATAERTAPANVLMMLGPETRAMLKEGGAAADQYYGRVAMWGVLGMYIANEAYEGRITGTGACLNSRTRSDWMEAKWRPLSTVSDTGEVQEWKGGAPMTSVVGYYASIGECLWLMDDPEFEDATADLVTASAFMLAQTVATQSFAGDILMHLDALVKPEKWKIDRIGESFLGQYVQVPAWLRSFERYEDGTIKNPDVGNLFEDLLAKFRADMPGMGEGAPPKVDFWGREMQRPGVGNILPTNEEDEYWLEASHMIVNGASMADPPKNMMLAGEQVKLNEREDDERGRGWVYYEYSTRLGQAKARAIMDAMADLEWDTTAPGEANSSDEQTRGDIINAYMRGARNDVMTEMAEFYEGTEIGDMFAREVGIKTPKIKPLPPNLRARLKQEGVNVEF